ncbi:hypothetical protein PN478_16855, partial [Dolichospermum circinale CS-534/05]|nr:hypothetical protein [Dolichospermum circinale CS-534/05]
FEIGELLAAALRYRYLNFRPFCIKIILTSPQKSEITDCDTGGCGMWVLTVWISSCLSADTAIFQIRQRKMHLDKYY